VALARCLAGGAQTVLMDEPLANLDPHLRGLMEDELARFHTAAGATTVYITHDQREAMALASRIAVMQGGRFLQVGTPEEIHDRPVSAEVARFIGRAAVVSAIRARTNAGPVLRLGPLEASVSAGRDGRVEAVLRPGDVRLGDGDVQGRVASAAYRGGGWEGRIAVEGLDETLPVASPRPLRVGELVPLSLSSAWVLPEA
jgi:iron(III) transport system ATP-binding protein